MLQREPRRRQRWKLDGWSGTPSDLVRLADAVRSLLPGGAFEVTVEVGDETLTSDQPGSLGDLPPGDTPDRVKAKVTGPLGIGADSLRVEVHLPSDVHVWGQDERDARALLESVKDQITPRVPWFATPRWRWATYAVVLAPGLLLLLLGYGTLAADRRAAAAGLIAAAFPLLFGSPWVAEWLFPRFELHGGRSQPRRLAWGIVAYFLLPLLIAVVVNQTS